MSAGEHAGRAYETLLQAITERLDWRLAAAWEPATADGGTLACVACWTTADDAQLDAFARATKSTIMRTGEGLPGRVFATEAPVWLTDAGSDDSLPRRDAARAAGLHVGVAFPVRSERGVVGVVELFGDRARAADPELLATLDLLGTMLGQLVERRAAERARAAATERHRATLQAALDCVVTMDAEGRVVEFNPAAERTFGYAQAQAVGREMADLIVPPELREPHRRGLRRYLQTHDPHLLDRRVEIEAIRAGGERFPVELTITRIDVPGAPMFTGHLREITERRKTEAELRESRARIVEAGYAARRQIERDLHDGAQQRLVGIAMSLRLAAGKLERDPATARELLGEATADLSEAIAELRELARGIHPAILTDGGLDPALRALARRGAVPVKLGSMPSRRFPAAIEAAAYFVVSEGLTNVAKHAGDTTATVGVDFEDDRLSVEVRDDGPGGADQRGRGLQGLADRVAALGGSLTVWSPPEGGTVLRAELPCGS